MSERAGAKGLKDQECEKGNRVRRPPIPYVPVVDEVQDALALKKERYETFVLPNKTKFKVRIWDAGTPEEFLNHVKEALHACERLGHFEDYKQAFLSREKAKRNAKKTEEAIKTMTSEGVGGFLLAGERERLDGFTEEAVQAEAKREEAAENFFSVYTNTFSIEARAIWDKIVSEQVGTVTWTDLKGRKRTKARNKSEKAFRECTVHHLRTVFKEDAAEQQRLYLSNTVKKPQRVSIRAFFTRVEQLNGYIKYLPTVHDSRQAAATSKPAAPYDEAELAGMLLRMCPETWQDHYATTQSVVPQDSRKLLLVLENIEKLCAVTYAPKPATANGNGNGNGKGNEKGKRKNEGSDAGRIPKKKRVEKHCTLCQKHGGASSSHNTNECTKYEKDGTMKTNWGTSKSKSKSSNKSDGKTFAQLAKSVSKLEKALKKAGRAASKKKKRHDDSDDSSTDSE